MQKRRKLVEEEIGCSWLLSSPRLNFFLHLVVERFTPLFILKIRDFFMKVVRAPRSRISPVTRNFSFFLRDLRDQLTPLYAREGLLLISTDHAICENFLNSVVNCGSYERQHQQYLRQGVPTLPLFYFIKNPCIPLYHQVMRFYSSSSLLLPLAMYSWANYVSAAAIGLPWLLQFFQPLSAVMPLPPCYLATSAVVQKMPPLTIVHNF